MNDYFIPFGKYQGYPLEVLFNDKGYLQWFLCQSDAHIHHREIYKEIIHRLIYQETNYQTPSNPKSYNLGVSSTSNPISERNKMVSDYVDPSFDWYRFTCEFFDHNEPGDIINLRFFADSIPIQFDYSNTNIEDFGEKHVFIQIVKELSDYFEPILQSLLNLNPDNDNVVIFIVGRVNTLGFTEEQVIQIFDSNRIHLHIKNPNPNQNSFTFESRASSNAKDDIPF